MLDTSFFRKQSVRAMKAPYKALFIYLLCECDHAGIWDVEMDVAEARLGMKLDQEKAVSELGGAVVEVAPGKWYLVDFVEFQYGALNPLNRVHASVLSRLTSLGIDPENKPLTSPLQGAKDMDKDKDKDTELEEKERANAKPEPKVIQLPFTSEAFALAWAGFEIMRKAKRKPITERARAMILADCVKLGEADAIRALIASERHGWTDIYPPKVEVASHASTLRSADPEKIHTGKL